MISAVAVLLIHMEQNAVASMNPMMMRLLEFVPTRRLTVSATRRCALDFSAARLIMNPARNSSTNLSPNARASCV